MKDEQVQAILNALPERRASSRLEPYAQLIDELRKLGRTYREIEQIFSDKCGIHAPRSTINDFVRRRRKGKIQKSQPLKERSGDMPNTAPPETKEVLRVGSKSSAADDVYQRIAALKQRPAPIGKSTDLFHYDPNEPLHLPDNSELKRPRE